MRLIDADTPHPQKVYCKDCKYLKFSDCYGECSKGYLGIVQPNDYCSRGERKETDND